MRCTLDSNKCITVGGDDPLKPCLFPFIENGTFFHFCTDKGSYPGVWCATERDEKNMTIDGKKGICNTDCSYCGGSPYIDPATASPGQKKRTDQCKTTDNKDCIFPFKK